MRIYLVTFGSRGDNEPFVALATAAADAGHDVVFAHTTDTPNRPDAGYREWELPGSLEALIVDQGVSIWKALRQYRSVWKPALDAVYATSTDHIRALKPDVVVYHPKVLTAPVIAHEVGALAVVAEMAPTLTPTGEFPAAGIPWSLPGWLNRASFRLIDWGLAAFGNQAAKLARKLGVSSHRPDLTLCPVSPAIVPQPADWPDTAIVTGHWHAPSRQTGASDPEVEAFLATGSVVYAGFGSMRNGDARARARAIVAGARSLGMKSLLVTGWGGLDPEPDLTGRQDVMVTSSVDHDRLAGAVDVAIHHGGAGTTHAFVRAGIPSVIMPFLGDQPWWATRLARLGLGPKPLSRHTTSPAVIASALAEALDCQERINVVSGQMSHEDGCAIALQAIQALWSDHHQAA